VLHTSPRAVISEEEWHRSLFESHSRLDRSALHRLIGDFLISEGFTEVAREFQKECGIEFPASADHVTDRMTMRREIVKGNVGRAIELCRSLYPTLLDQPQHASLSFALDVQRMLEFVRCKQLETALAFARAELAPRALTDSLRLEQLEKALSLLAFDPPDSPSSPHASLLSLSHRQECASHLNAALLAEQKQSSRSDLEQLLASTLWRQHQLAQTHSFPMLSYALVREPEAKKSVPNLSFSSSLPVSSSSSTEPSTSRSLSSQLSTSSSPPAAPALLLRRDDDAEKV